MLAECAPCHIILKIIVQTAEQGGVWGSWSSRCNSLCNHSSPLKKTCDTHSSTSLSCLQRNGWCEVVPFSSPLCYYSLLGCLPVVRVNRSCPCCCTWWYLVYKQKWQIPSSPKGAIIYCFLCRAASIFLRPHYVYSHETCLTAEWWMAFDRK